MNLPLLAKLWLLNDTYSGNLGFRYLSATTLLKSTRNIIANLRIKYPEEFPEHLHIIGAQKDVILPSYESLIPAVLGRAIHKSFEESLTNIEPERLELVGLPPDILNRVSLNTEGRTEKSIGDWIITGQYDFVFAGKLTDLKTTSTYSYTSGCNDEKYSLQGSIYRWLNPELITEDLMSIIFVFKDFNKNYVYSRDGYPIQMIVEKEYSLLTLPETERFIKKKLREIEKFMYSPLWEIPCCTDKDLYAGKVSTWKYYKTGYAEGKRSTKNFDNYAEALMYKAQNKGMGDIIEDKGKPFKCPCCDISTN